MLTSYALVSISGRLGAGKSTVAEMYEAAGNWESIAAAPDTVARVISGDIGPRNLPSGSPRPLLRGLVIDGLRSAEECMLLKARYGDVYTSIHVEAHRDIRMLRRMGWTEFESEFYAADDSTGPTIDRLTSCADYCIFNEGSIDHLAREVAPIIVRCSALTKSFPSGG